MNLLPGVIETLSPPIENKERERIFKINFQTHTVAFASRNRIRTSSFLSHKVTAKSKIVHLLLGVAVFFFLLLCSVSLC